MGDDLQALLYAYDLERAIDRWRNGEITTMELALTVSAIRSHSPLPPQAWPPQEPTDGG